MGALFEKYRGFIIDLDGVLYLLDTPVPGSAETVSRLSELGLRFVFLTNNSASTPGQYVEKLARFGVSVEPSQVVASSHAVARHLDDSYDTRGRTAFVIGEDGLRGEIDARGMRVLEGADARAAEFVFVGWDRTFDFEKLKTAVIAIRAGAVYIATNVDATYPTPEGLWPGAGSIVAAVTAGAGREPYVAGKPNPLIVEIALERMGLEASEALLIGDRLDTDIKAGQLAGVDTMLVLTGVSSREEIGTSGIRPTHVRDDLAALTAGS